MVSRFSYAFVAMPAKAKIAFYTALVFALLLVLAGNGFAATPTNASLNGPYAFQFSTSKEAYWFTSKSCIYKGVQHGYSTGGQTTYTELNYGTVTFDGKGHVTLNMTDTHQINQAATNATATIVCNSNGTATTHSGNIVYEPPVSGTMTGTYSVSADGSGTITLPDGQGTVDLELSLFNSAGLSTTVLMRSPATDNNYGTGIAVHK